MSRALGGLRDGFSGWRGKKKEAAVGYSLLSTLKIPKADCIAFWKKADIDDSQPFGLVVLAEGVNPVVDIVAVHGLNGHREKTWTASNGVFWLRDLLPTTIPNARIISWGYDANTHSTSPTSVQYIHDHATTLVSDLVLERRLSQTEKRPIIFLTHSLGGIVVKEALIHCSLAGAHHLGYHRSIKISTCGIIFLGTPHQGGDGVAWGERLLMVASVFVYTNTKLLENLRQSSDMLQRQLEQYAPISGDFITKFAYETYPTPLPVGSPLLVVPKSSAVVPGVLDAESVAIMANHLEMTKYPSEIDMGYRKVSGHLQLIIQEANTKVQLNWDKEWKINMLNTPTLPNPLARTAEGIAPTDYDHCIDWLSFPGYDAREGLITATYPGTCNWVLEDEGFVAWVQSVKGIFWIKGKPGSGKSTIMKHLLDLIRSEKASGLSNIFPVYAATFFNARGSSLEASREGFLRSSIIQILQQKPELFKYIEEDYLGSKKQLSEPLLTKILKNLVRECSLTSRLGLLVDALDECDGPIREQLGLFEELIRISQESGYLMSICVSGRPVHTLTALLGHYPQLTLEDHTSVDIATYVLAKTSRISSTTDGYIYKEFRKDIMEKSKGVFLWVVLVVEELLDAWEASESIAGLRMRLAAIPEDLCDFFGRMLRRIPRSQLSETAAVFKCVLAALRPLTLKELRVALAFGSDDSFGSIAEMRSSDKVVHGDDGLERRVQSCCGGLIEIKKESLTVQVIHQTVLEYLLAPTRLQSVLADQPGFTLAQCHQYLLQACINYLSVPELKGIPVHFWGIFGATEKPNYLEYFEFLSYSLLNWVDHYIGAEEGGESQAPKIEEFARPENVSSTDSGEFGGPVQAATIGGNLEMVRLLLDHGVDVNAQGGKFGTAMAAAITFQNHEMIKLLCEYGAKILLQAPGSPMFGRRNPFSRSRVSSNALAVVHSSSMSDQGLGCYGNKIGYTAPIVTATIGAVYPTFYQPAPNYSELTNSADGSGLAYNEITMSDQEFQVHLTCEGDGGSGDGLATAADDE